MNAAMNTIHKTAVVDPAARLGEGITIGPFAVIESDVELGDGCVIGPHVTLLGRTRLGRECRVHAGAVLGDLPQDLGYKDAVTRVWIGDRCTFREGVTVHRGTKPETVTEIGDDCYLMAFTHCAHNVKLGTRVIMANGALLAGYVEVGDGCFFGGLCAVHQFVRIGRLCMIGGESAITQDVLPFSMIKTSSYNVVAGPNTVGLRRAGVPPAERQAIRHALQVLCRSGLTTPQAVAQLRTESPPAVVEELCTFATRAKRGFCRGETATAASESVSADT